MAVSVSVWASSFAASWSSPGSLFILLNLTIGTIFLMTRFGARKAPEHHHVYSHQLARAPSSILDRVKSINFSLYNFEPPSAAQTELHQEPDHATEYPHQLVPTPSLLERLKSIKLYRSEPEIVHRVPSPEVYDHGHAAEYPSHPVNPTPLVRTPSLLERVKSINLYRFEPEIIHPNPSREVHDSGHVTEYPSHPDNRTELVRTPSLLERLKSIKLDRAEQPDQKREPEFHDHGVKRSESESESKVKRRAEKMTKSASEKSAAAREEEEDGGEEENAVVERRRPATTSVEKSSRGVDQTAPSWEDDGVDAKADDFINRFKQQLRLQRLESLKRFREMWKGK